MSAVKRMHRDIRDYLRSTSLNEQGIFCIFDEEDIFRVHAMIVGPEDTPYFGGYYFFDVKFPTEYPHRPPTVTYETRWQDIRFHPNLYASSKVCLSILGTWIGPGWTSAQTMSSVLLTIQSLLTKDPLTNEPGYEIRTPYAEKKHKLYETLVTYENYRTSIFRMLESPPQGFEAFLPIMQKCFVVNAHRIYASMKANALNEPTTSSIRCGVYNFKRFINYPECVTLLEQMMHSCGLSEECSSDEPATDSSVLVGVDVTTHVLTDDPSNPMPTDGHIPFTQMTENPKKLVNRPTISAKLCQGSTQDVVQPNGHCITFTSKKCKQLDPTKPEKWQWRRKST